jgi:hypothetical protein
MKRSLFGNDMEGTIMDPAKYALFYQNLHEPLNKKELSKRQLSELDS